MREQQSISEIIGEARGADGATIVVVYRALRALMCAGCGATINRDEQFTRREVTGAPAGGLRLSARCARCASFAETRVVATIKQKKTSPLIEALLSTAPREPKTAQPPQAQTSTTPNTARPSNENPVTQPGKPYAARSPRATKDDEASENTRVVPERSLRAFNDVAARNHERTRTPVYLVKVEPPVEAVQKVNQRLAPALARGHAARKRF